MTTITATYSPEDNKLRLYPSARLDAETYARVRAAGFIWAPKQELFVAPAWSPERADLAEELAGEIGDEDTSLVDRAEVRAERFDGYADRRAADSECAQEAVAAIADGIPLGQPILVGHHSERRARKDAERIESGMRRAVKMWETSRYWTERAAGALAHAKYKERPDVRARRIKGLESDLRGYVKRRGQSEAAIALWAQLDTLSLTANDGSGREPTLLDRALWLANRHGVYGTWSDLRDGKITPEEAREKSIDTCARHLVIVDRWITHTENRLTYERAMLAESGWTPPPKPKTSATLPLLNYPGEVAYRNTYRAGEIIRAQAHGMTKAEFAAIHADYKGTRVSECGTHRVRTALVGSPRSLVAVYLTDSKQHARPGSESVAARAAEEAQERVEAALDRAERPRHPAPPTVPPAVAAMRESLRAGVQVVSAPQLFPTPPDLARRLVAAADVQPGHRVLEPSAGTGELVRAAWGAMAGPDCGSVVAVEVNGSLAAGLEEMRRKWIGANEGNCAIVAGDFLEQNGNLGRFDRVVMNPPFSAGADIRHVLHARTFLKPGGRLAAIVANGPRQDEKLRPLASSWEDLPSGTFAGTGVRTALVVIEAAP